MLMFMVNMSTLIGELCAIKCVYTHYIYIKQSNVGPLNVYSYIALFTSQMNMIKSDLLYVPIPEQHLLCAQIAEM